MAKKEPRLERIVYETDRRSAQKLRNLLMKVLSKDKKSDGMKLSYVYKPFRKKADYTIEGNAKTVLKCLKTFHKFVMKREKADAKREAATLKAVPLPTGKYYTMKSAKERKTRV